MRFDKAPLAIDQLVDHLVSIRLTGELAEIAQRLQDVGYYRLSPYWRFFRVDPGTHGSPLRDGTDIDGVWRLYTFDREFRLLVFDATERIEIAVRSRLVQAHVRTHGPFGYAEGACVPLDASDPRSHYGRLLRDVEDTLADAVRDPNHPRVTEALRHFSTRYGDSHQYLPLWLAAESFSFGDLVTLYRGSPREIRESVAASFNVQEPVFRSWLLTVQTTRNVCAHHNRLWNRVSRVAPMVPRKDAAWSDPRLGPTNRTFYVMTILAHLMGVVSDGSGWARRFRDLVEVRYAGVPQHPIGMREGWAEHPIWKARLV